MMKGVGEGAALAFDGVSKRFGRLSALSEVSWAMAAGDKTCLLGPNGAGKSTSIRLLEGALKPSAGEVWLLGANPGTPGYEGARRRTGIVPQGPGMYEELSVGDYLELTRRLYGAGKDQGVAEVFGLGPYMKQRLARLSGGFQRRVVVAAALSADPEVLLLDEPTVGLDPLARHEVKEFLKSRMEGRTTLLCTHNLAEAQELCEKVVILEGGKVVVQARIRDLVAGESSVVEMAARGGVDSLRAALSEMDEEASVVSADRVRVVLRDARAEVPGILKRLVELGLEVYEVRVVEASLEEVFLERVGRPQ